jgi:hypothetical protein
VYYYLSHVRSHRAIIAELAYTLYKHLHFLSLKTTWSPLPVEQVENLWGVASKSRYQGSQIFHQETEEEF